jgi:hypothetical protein
VSGEEEVQADLEDLLGAGSGVGMGERGASVLQLCQEAAGDGDVEAAQLGGEGLGAVAAGSGRRRRHVWHRWHRHVPYGCIQFYW